VAAPGAGPGQGIRESTGRALVKRGPSGAPPSVLRLPSLGSLLLPPSSPQFRVSISLARSMLSRAPLHLSSVSLPLARFFPLPPSVLPQSIARSLDAVVPCSAPAPCLSLIRHYRPLDPHSPRSPISTHAAICVTTWAPLSPRRRRRRYATASEARRAIETISGKVTMPARPPPPPPCPSYHPPPWEIEWE
jgi:hypothetical protein